MLRRHGTLATAPAILSPRALRANLAHPLPAALPPTGCRQGDPSLAPQRTRRWQRLVSWRWQRAGRRDEEGAEAGAGAGAGAAPASAPIDRIVLVGGATRMPCIGRFLRRMTGAGTERDTLLRPPRVCCLIRLLSAPLSQFLLPAAGLKVKPSLQPEERGRGAVGGMARIRA